jgi:hypothetical protein
MIRDLREEDVLDLIAIHRANGLPANCLPAFSHPLFAVKRIVDIEGKLAMGGFLKVTSEVYLLLDHTVGSPEERMEWLRELSKDLEKCAFEKGLEDLTLWVPPEVESSFGKRLEDLGYRKSPWSSYTLKL